MNNSAIKNVVFDLGNVLIAHDPRNMYRKMFAAESDMENFLSQICTHDWNEQQDAGRPFAEGVRLLCEKHPDLTDLIQAYDTRWEEMLAGPIEGTVRILEKIKAGGKHRVLALSNWSAEKFPAAVNQYAFLNLFEGIVVSGRIGLKKPDPKIFRYLCEEHSIQPRESLFIDDLKANINVARELGFQTIHFVSPARLEQALIERSILLT